MRELWPDTQFISLFLIFSCTFWLLAPSAPQVCLSLCFLVVVLFQTSLFLHVLRIFPSRTLFWFFPLPSPVLQMLSSSWYCFLQTIAIC